MSFDGLVFFFLWSFLVFHIDGGQGKAVSEKQIKLSKVKDYSLLRCISILGCVFADLLAKKACGAWHQGDKNTEL